MIPGTRGGLGAQRHGAYDVPHALSHSTRPGLPGAGTASFLTEVGVWDQHRHCAGGITASTEPELISGNKQSASLPRT